MKFKVVALTEVDGITRVVLETSESLANVHNHCLKANDELELSRSQGWYAGHLIEPTPPPAPHPSGRVVNTVASLTGRGR